MRRRSKTVRPAAETTSASLAPGRPLEAFFESALDAVLVADDRGRYVEVNPAACELIGLPRAEILGRHIQEFSGSDVDATTMFAQFRAAGRTSGSFRLNRPDGTVREVEYAATADVLPGLHLSILRDVTARRRAERELERRVGELQRIYDLADSVSRAVSLEEIYAKALDALTGDLGADRGSVLLFDHDGVMRFKASRGISDAYRKKAEGHSPWSSDTRDPQPVLVPDVKSEPTLSALSDFIVEEGIHALAFIPLLDEGRLLGKLMIYYDAPHRFSPEDVRLAETVGRHVAFVISRSRSESALRESEESYRTLFEANPVAMWLRDPTTLAFVAVNDTALRQYGYTREEFLPLTVRDLLAPDDLESISEFGWDRTTTLEPWNAGIRRHRRKDGSTLWVEVTGRDVFSSGRPLRLILAKDVTERRRVEEEDRFLAEASALLGSSLDNRVSLEALTHLVVPRFANGCVIDLLDSQGVPVRVAVAHSDSEMESLPRRYPINPSAPFGVYSVVRSGQAELVPDVSDETLASVAWDAQHARLLKAMVGSYICVPLKARDRMLGAMTLIRSPGAERYGSRDLALAQELARRTAFAVDNARLLEEAREASAQKSRFLSAVSHDLRTPATAITLLSSLVRREAASIDGTGSLVDRCRRLEGAASSFADLLSDLLEIGSFDSGQKRMRDDEFPLEDVVRQCVETCTPAAREKSIPIRVRWESTLPSVRADRTEFARVLMNLLSNAVKFTETGVVKVEISRMEPGDLEVRVRDTGPGIPAEHLPSVFSEFFQVRNSERDRSKGSGLGLAISRRIMQALGGTLRVESRIGVGSTFTATLPADRVLGPARSGEVRDQRQPDPVDSTPARRILVIDDDSTSREALSVLLGAEGYEVFTASGGDTGLEVAAAEKPDVLLLDMMMPGMDGLEVIHRIRCDPELEHVRIVALTGDVTRERLQNVLASGADQFVAKPFRIPALLESVRAILRPR
jgi:PAS domain S-box-containing protein